MKTMMLIYEGPDGFADRANERAQEYWGAWSAYTEALAAAGIVVEGAVLQTPESSTTVRVSGSDRSVQDGPFLEAKEGLGGYIVLDVPDLETAIEWAARAPQTPGGGIELRPLLEMSSAA